MKAITVKREAPNAAIFPHKFQNEQQMWLHWHEWWPRTVAAKDVKGVLFLTSGLGEHALRYDGFAEEVAEELQFAVFSLDHQGHGLSEGKRKYVDRFAYYINDYCQFLMLVLNRYGPSNKHGIDITAMPRFLLGHSMGGLIALHTARRCATGIPQQYTTPYPTAAAFLKGPSSSLVFNGLILSGPAIKPDPTVATPTKQKLASMLSNWAPNMGLGNLAIETICGNPQVVEQARKDPLFAKDPLRARWGYEMLVAMNDVKENSNTFLNFPLLIVHGEKDTLCLPEGSHDFFAAAAAQSNKKLVVYKNMLHEILNEVGCEEVRAEVKGFIRQEMGRSPNDTVVFAASSAAAAEAEPAVPAASEKKAETGCA